MLSLHLPWPVSTNNLWRFNVKSRTNYPSPEYTKWKTEAFAELQRHKTVAIRGRFNIDVVLTPPDNREYDPDNKIKALLDFLRSFKLIEGDSCRFVNDTLIRHTAPNKRFSGAHITIQPVEGELATWEDFQPHKDTADLHFNTPTLSGKSTIPLDGKQLLTAKASPSPSPNPSPTPRSISGSTST